MKSVLAIVLQVAGTAATWASPPAFFPNDYGSHGDGKSLDTEAIQRAIDGTEPAFTDLPGADSHETPYGEPK